MTASGQRSLSDLHEIVMPDGVTWWPPAPGWYVLAGVVVVAAVWLGVVLVHRHRALGYRRAALAELRALRRDLSERGGASALHAGALLKRTAMHVHSRARVAGLHGDAWLRFLDEHGGDGRFAGEIGAALLEASYGDPDGLSRAQIDALVASIDSWIRRQGVPSTDGEGAVT